MMIYHLEQQKIECGTIDIEKALTEGIKAFEPGLLAKRIVDFFTLTKLIC
jgi:hypothetical protein